MCPRMAAMVEDRDPTSSVSCVSDCESSVTGPVHCISRSCMGPVKRLEENSPEHIQLKHIFYSSLGSLSPYCRIVAMYKNAYSTHFSVNQLEAFQLSLESIRRKRGGDPNVKLAWYGSSRDGVGRIICGGFSRPEKADSFGLGLHLFPENCVTEGIQASTVDAYGLRHLILCKVILGNTEQLPAGSNRSSPSSEEFDSGVDDQMHPKRYIIWNEQLKEHILPMYVVSIKLEHRMRDQCTHVTRKPTSPWIPLATLVSMLSGCLPPNKVCMIKKLHNAYVERKMSRQQMIQAIRQLAGDRLLVIAIRAFQDKQMKVAFSSAFKRGKRM